MTSPKKTLLAISVHNVVDVITNSSSELFVLKGETKEIATEMIRDIYPDFESEYEPLKHISELSNDELDTLVSYHCSAHCWPSSKDMLPILNGYTFDELYEPERDWKTGKIKPPAWNGEIQYRLKNNLPTVCDRKYQPTSFVTDDNRDRVIKAIEDTIGNYFLYSIDDNPDWSYQEDLMKVAKRYHLG
jgi:hypothetical protein